MREEWVCPYCGKTLEKLPEETEPPRCPTVDRLGRCGVKMVETAKALPAAL